MTGKKVLRIGVVASLVAGVFYLASPQALHRAVAAIASAVWGS
jgi:hypothetical protein